MKTDTKDTPEQTQAIIAALAELWIYPFKNESSDPKTDAQRNVGRISHYFDDDTLRFHKGRVNTAGTLAGGLVFFAGCTDALDMHNTKRGHRYVAFDVFGEAFYRPDLEHAQPTDAKARKQFEEFIATVSITEHYRSAIARKLSESRANSNRLELAADKVEKV